MIDTALTDSEKAFFTIQGQSAKIALDFNPVTLQLTVQTQAKGEGNAKVQHVSSSSAKLDLELTFDSTDTGQDVRKRTQPLERLLVPADNKPPPQVKFEWGAFSFEGVADSFKQTLDFFSRNGVPLRAVVGLSLSQPKYVFDPLASTLTGGVNGTLDLAGGSPTSVAAAGGDPGAARQIASGNGLENLRADAGGGLSVGGGVSIGAAAGFSGSAGAGLGLSGGVGGGIGAGLGVSAGINIGGGVGGGAGFGATAGGGLGGSFAGLHADARVTSGAGKNFDSAKLLASVSAPAVSAGAGFDVSGKASVGAGSSFKADVSGGVTFDEF